MKKNIIIASTAALAVIVTTAVVAVGTYAFGGGGMFFGAGNDAAKQAIENNDYQGWLSAVGTGNPLAGKITADNFSQYSQAYKDMASGDYQGARAIQEELGIGPMMGMRGHGRFGGGFGFTMNSDAQAALTAGNYNDWLAAVGADSPIAGKVSEANFPKLVQAYNDIKSGNTTEAKQLLSDLGLNTMEVGGFGRFDGKLGRGMNADALAALESGDYAAWQSAVGTGSQIAKTIDSQDKFNKLSEANKLMEQARGIMNDLGLSGGPLWQK